ncbi:NAD(P)H-dependent oxidoreductase [Candidatus Uhrbacteria bacterium UHB]|nr:NAD(P)H-dependent oxidoreductase [Candidatus Uhrbacteria bacterium UHB]RIL00694.1 MAG: NADPH-dependent FMN reductase [Candidatus Uhrbacteria bacterium]
MERLNIPVLLGTAREGRASEGPAKYIHRLLLEKDVESALIDPRDYHEKKTFEKERVQPWADIMKRADGLVIVTPEYNHGYPGPLKEMLDALYEEFARKPVAVCGVSAGMLGGARVVEQVKLVAIELHMCPIRESVYFSDVRNLFNEKGDITDPGFDARCAQMFEELFWFTRALKAGREGVVRE